MQLADFMKKNRWKLRAFAAHCGLSFTSVRNVIRGIDIKISTCDKIEKATGGQVTYKDIIKNLKKK